MGKHEVNSLKHPSRVFHCLCDRNRFGVISSHLPYKSTDNFKVFCRQEGWSSDFVLGELGDSVEAMGKFRHGLLRRMIRLDLSLSFVELRAGVNEGNTTPSEYLSLLLIPSIGQDDLLTIGERMGQTHVLFCDGKQIQLLDLDGSVLEVLEGMGKSVFLKAIQSLHAHLLVPMPKIDHEEDPDDKASRQFAIEEKLLDSMGRAIIRDILKTDTREWMDLIVEDEKPYRVIGVRHG